jgi:hypothetical protein
LRVILFDDSVNRRPVELATLEQSRGDPFYREPLLAHLSAWMM